MRFLQKTLREITYAAGLLLGALILGNILYRVLADLIGGMDRSESAAQGASLLFALVLLTVVGVVRLYRRRRKAGAARPAAPGRSCAKCGAPASADDAFCMRCGSSLAVSQTGDVRPPLAPERPMVPTVEPVMRVEPVLPVRSVPPLQTVLPIQPALPVEPLPRTEPIEPVAPVAHSRRSPVVRIAVGSAVVAVTAFALGAGAVVVWLRSDTPTLAYASTGASRAMLDSAASVINRRLALAELKGEARVKGDLILLFLQDSATSNIGSVDEMVRKRGKLEFLPVAGPESADKVSAFAPFVADDTSLVTYRSEGAFEVPMTTLSAVRRQLQEEPPPPPLAIVWDTGRAAGIEWAWIVDRSQAFSGPSIERSELAVDGSGRWTIHATFLKEPGTGGADSTPDYLGKTVVWTMDGTYLVAPRMRAPIGGSVQLDAGTQEYDARQLAWALGFGTLPVELTRVPANRDK